MILKAKHVLIGALAVSAILLGAASPVGAHTGFESSSPADGDVVDEPVSEIVLRFAGEATPAGEGFVVLDPTGAIREPDEITSADNLTWTLRFDEPLAGGNVGVRWMVAAPDAHPIDGSFSFTVNATTPEQTATILAHGVEQTSTEDTETSLSDPSDQTATATIEQPGEILGSVDGLEGATASSAVAPVDLESFLEPETSDPAAVGTVASTARALSILGAVLVIGASAFAAFGLRGDTADVVAVLYWVRRGSLIVLAGAIAEAASMTATLAGEWSALASPRDLQNALWTSAGLAIALRAAGSLTTAVYTTLDTTVATAAGDPVIAARQLATVGGGHSTPPPPDRAPDEPFIYTNDHTWNHDAGRLGLLGIALIAVSFMFDGHTASEGPLLLHAIANAIHVTTAAIWAGGVTMLALTIHRRSTTGRPTQALQLAMRFSVIATIALIAAGLAGIALSAIVLDSISEIWSTPWGRLLALKVTLVAAAAAGGAYNHRIVVPALDRNPNHQPTIDRFRTIVTLEAAALLSVAIVTAFLIAASST